MIYDTDKDVVHNDSEQETPSKPRGFAQETLLELVEVENGKMVLREVNGSKDALITIDFSKKVQDILGGETHAIGQHMIHSAIQLVMHKQISHWHAHVYDKEPERYS